MIANVNASLWSWPIREMCKPSALEICDVILMRIAFVKTIWGELIAIIISITDASLLSWYFSAIASTVLTRKGEGFYLASSSELQRFSVAARRVVVPDCSLALPEGSRPVPEVTEEPEKLTNGDHTEAAANADTSLNTTGNDETHNTSVLPSDVTMDSIRDYTSNQTWVKVHSNES